ncbi:hypothetical protein B1T50_04775 [Mycobacterium kansasii]|nr:hypothetical protein B1T50_04775 [Mycobacterium kansasii]
MDRLRDENAELVIRLMELETENAGLRQGGKLMDTVDNLRPLDHITDEALLFHRDWQMGSVVQEVHTGDCCEGEEFCDFYPQLWEMAFMCGWTRSGSYYNPDDDSPRLPVRVLWNPAWEDA